MRVVELASVLAGPAVGMFFSELGAEVIKIENARTGGDVTRKWKSPGQDDSAPDSPYYHSINFGKTTYLLDLQQGSDRDQVYDWIANCDIVISNYRPSVAAKLGMDYAHLSGLNSRLIFAELSGYGPADSRPAFDVVLQAESGFLGLTGYPDQPPAKMPVALIDLLAGHQLKEGILTALWQREQSGKGAHIHVSLYDAAVSSLANQATNWLMGGYAPRRMGTAHPNIAPYGDLFVCADEKELVLAVGSEVQFRALCTVLHLPELTADPRFVDNASRLVHRAALNGYLATALRLRKRAACLDLLEKHNVPAGAVLSIPEVFEQPAAQRLLLRQSLADGRETVCVRTVVFRINPSVA